jgi:Helix-turn-helix
VRRAVAEVATARKRLELQISQLAAAEGSAQRTGTLHQLRDEYARLGMEEARLGSGAQQLQSWVSEFRSRKEALKASYAVAEAQRTINTAYAEFGTQAEGVSAPFPAADATIQSLAGGIAGITRAAGQEPPPGEPATAAPAAPGQPEVMLAELRCGWPSELAQRILFTVEDSGRAEDDGRPEDKGPAAEGRRAGEGSPPAVAVLLAAGPAVSPLRGEADTLIPLALDRYQAARDQPGTRYTSESFGHEFFPGSTAPVRAAAAALAARTLPRPPGQLRRQAGVTQAELAERMGVRQERVSAIERADPGAAEVRTLAGYVQALGGRLVLVADFGADQVILG